MKTGFGFAKLAGFTGFPVLAKTGFHSLILGTSTLAAAPGDLSPRSSLHVSDRHGWWLRLAVKTTAGDGMLMLQAAGASVV